MFKSRPWTPKELKSVGGAFGVGETFLEETFERKFFEAISTPKRIGAGIPGGLAS